METLPSDKEHPDHQLFRRFCAGRAEAIRQVYRAGFPVVEKLVTGNGGNIEDTEDLFHEVLLVLINRCGQENFRLTTALPGYIYGIARNLWLKKLKNSNRSGITFQDIEEYVNMNVALRIQEEEALEVHQFRLLWKNMSRLSDREQKVLKLYYLEEKSHQEIAKIMGFADARSARVQKFKYLEKLKKLVRQDPDFE